MFTTLKAIQEASVLQSVRLGLDPSQDPSSKSQ